MPDVITKRIRMILEEKNLTQKQLAENINKLGYKTAKSTIEKWCSGDVTPSANGIIALSKVFKCDTDYLLGLQEEPDKEAVLFAEKTGLSYENAEKIQSLGFASKMVLSYLLENNEAFNDLLEYLYKISKTIINTPEYRDDYRNPPRKRKHIEGVDDLSRKEYHKMMNEFEKRLSPFMGEIMETMIDAQYKHVDKAVDIYKDKV